MSNAKERWVVNFIDGDGSDDWQLMQNSHKKYFHNLEEAKSFAEGYVFKKKPSYWQPSIYREVEFSVTSRHWKREDLPKQSKPQGSGEGEGK